MQSLGKVPARRLLILGRGRFGGCAYMTDSEVCIAASYLVRIWHCIRTPAQDWLLRVQWLDFGCVRLCLGGPGLKGFAPDTGCHDEASPPKRVPQACGLGFEAVPAKSVPCRRERWKDRRALCGRLAREHACLGGLSRVAKSLRGCTANARHSASSLEPQRGLAQTFEIAPPTPCCPAAVWSVG